MNSPPTQNGGYFFPGYDPSGDFVDERFLSNLLPDFLSNDASTRTNASDKIMMIQKIPGFSTLLLNISNDKSASESLRLQCMVFLNDVVDRYWRPRSSDLTVPNEEKTVIRNRLLSDYMDEPSDVVALHVATIVGAIAKLDWPRMWPDLLPTLVSACLHEPGLTQLRGLLMMHHMVKALTYKTCRGTKLQFHELGHQLFTALVELWKAGGDLLLTTLSSYSNGEIGDEDLLNIRYEAEVAKWAIKILSRLVIYAFEDFSTDPLAVSFYIALLERFPFTLECAENVQNNALMKYIHTFNKVYGKLLVTCQANDSISFLVIAEPALHFAFEQVTKAVNTDQVTIRCMTLLKEVVIGLGNIGDYKGGDKERLLTEKVFTNDRISELCQILIAQYFMLTGEELEYWSQNAEGAIQYINNSADSEDCARNVAEALFLAVISQWPDQTIPLILDAINMCSEKTHHAFAAGGQELEHYFSLEQILFRDACYHAACTAHYQLVKHLNFAEWFEKHWQYELAQLRTIPPLDGVSYNDTSHFDYRTSITRRRACLVIGKWAAEIADEFRKTIYDEMIELFSSTRDLGVALPATWALECLVNDLKFNVTIDQFEPHIDSIISALFEIIQRCQSVDSFRKILNTLGLLIEGIASRVEPYTTKLLKLIEDLWNSTNEALLQASLIGTLCKLVVSLEGDATNWYSYIIPVINYATRVSGNCSDNMLLEDGILLWLSTLRSATEFSPDLLALFHNLTAIIQGGITRIILVMCIKLLESYILLGQVEFLQAHVDDLAIIFTSWVGDTQDDLVSDIMRPLEIMLMLYPKDMPIYFTAILEKLLHLIFTEQESDIVLCYYIHFFNRLLLHNSSFYIEWLDRTGNQWGQSDLLIQFINLVIERIDQLGDLRRRKIAAMALTKLLEYQLLVESNIDLMALTVETIIGVVCDEEKGDGPEYLVRPDESHVTDEIYVPELKHNSVQSKQLLVLYTGDPVNCYTGKEFLQSHLEAAQQTYPAAFHAMMERVNPIVLAGLASAPASDQEGES